MTGIFPLPKPDVQVSCLSENADDKDAIVEAYFDAFFEESVWESLFDILERLEHENLEALASQSLLTQGQRVFLVLEYFRAEMLNGGFGQFLGNAGFLTDDVVECLSIIGLNELAELTSQAARDLKPLFDVVESMPGNASNSVVRKAVRELDRKVGRYLNSDPTGGKLSNGFVMIWDDEKKQLLWREDQFAEQLLSSLILYIEANFPEFVSEDASTHPSH